MASGSHNSNLVHAQCITALRAWKDAGYPGEPLNDTDAMPGSSIEFFSPEETGFVRWHRQTGDAVAYRDQDGTPRGESSLSMPEAKASAIPRAALVYLHGGGYRKYKPRDSYIIAITSRLAVTAGAPVLALDYRLAPEYDVSSGAAIEDAIAGLHWLAAKYPQASLFLVGDSAGAGLALATTLALLRRQATLPSGVVALSPYIDLTMTSPGFETQMFSYSTNCGDLFYTNHQPSPGAADDEADRAWLRARAHDYTGNSANDPFASPAFLESRDLARFPPMLAMVGGNEVFLHETEELCQRATKAGAHCTLRVFPEMWHDWFNFCELPRKLSAGSEAAPSSPALLEPAIATYDEISKWIDSVS